MNNWIFWRYCLNWITDNIDLCFVWLLCIVMCYRWCDGLILISQLIRIILWTIKQLHVYIYLWLELLCQYDRCPSSYYEWNSIVGGNSVFAIGVYGMSQIHIRSIQSRITMWRVSKCRTPRLQEKCQGQLQQIISSSEKCWSDLFIISFHVLFLYHCVIRAARVLWDMV